MSQSPAGSAADFHHGDDLAEKARDRCRNPPQGPPPISTHVPVFRQTTNSKGVAIPRRVRRRFPRLHRWPRERREVCVAIPRRVRRRFPRVHLFTCRWGVERRNPPQGPPPISTPPSLLGGVFWFFVSQSPAGSAADFHLSFKLPVDVDLSQSPAGSAADFHKPDPTAQAAVNECRNPPQGPPPISTIGDAIWRSLPSCCRNPPQGPPPISTSGEKLVELSRFFVSQSPAGSAADFHFSTPPEVVGGSSGVAIPRRVSRRFPPSRGKSVSSVASSCRNPPQGPPPISTRPCYLMFVAAVTLSQSPAGSDADFHNDSRWRLSPSQSLSQSPAGSDADFHQWGHARCRSQERVAIPRRVRRRFPPASRPRRPTSWSSCRNPPQGPPPISTNSAMWNRRRMMFCRNPPQGPPPISTSSRISARPPRRVSQSPAGSAADFHLVERRGDDSLLLRSQSPAGSAADFHSVIHVWLDVNEEGRNPPQGPPPISTRLLVLLLAVLACVAIPRRVRRRFPRQPPDRQVQGRGSVAIPRRVRRRFPPRKS